MLLILGNLSFPGTLNFIGELFSIVSIGNIDYSFMRLVLLNVLLTSCYSFFTMSIVYLIGQAEIYEYYKDTNRIESSFIFLLFGIIHLRVAKPFNPSLSTKNNSKINNHSNKTIQSPIIAKEVRKCVSNKLI